MEDTIEKARAAAEASLPTQDERVKLDVGGVAFVTTRSTLLRIPQTFFARLVSWEPNANHAAASHFIDRDGTHFRYVLNYLRDGQVDLPPNDTALHSELAREAEFYQLPELKAQALAALARACGQSGGISAEACEHEHPASGDSKPPLPCTKVLQVLPSMGAMTAYALSWEANQRTVAQCQAEAQRETNGMVELVPLSNDSTLSFPLNNADSAVARRDAKAGQCVNRWFNMQLPLWKRVRELEADGYRIHTVQCTGQEQTVAFVVLTLAGCSGVAPSSMLPIS